MTTNHVANVRLSLFLLKREPVVFLRSPAIFRMRRGRTGADSHLIILSLYEVEVSPSGDFNVSVRLLAELGVGESRFPKIRSRKPICRFGKRKSDAKSDMCGHQFCSSQRVFGKKTGNQLIFRSPTCNTLIQGPV
jgi:hypothetical protein